jgi:hypothetical protein
MTDNSITGFDENNAAGVPEDGQKPTPAELPEAQPEEIRPRDNEIKAVETFHPVERIADKPNGDRAKWTDKAIVVLTAGIVFLAFMQWLEMHEGGKQTDRIIAADERMAGAMEGAVDQAKISFEAANKQAILSQRAWIIGVVLRRVTWKFSIQASGNLQIINGESVLSPPVATGNLGVSSITRL